MVVEGVYSGKGGDGTAENSDTEPIIEQVNQILFEGDPKEAVSNLMLRD